jgi:hypothetical protein
MSILAAKKAPSENRTDAPAPITSSELRLRQSAKKVIETIVAPLVAPRRTPVEESRVAVTRPASKQVRHMTLDEVVVSQETEQKRRKVEESLKRSSPASRVAPPTNRSGASLAAAAMRCMRR